MTKMFYLNDEGYDILVRVMDSRYDPITCSGDVHVTLKPCEGRLFELQIPEGHILYVKKWLHMVLLSHVAPSALAQLGPDQHHQSDASEAFSLLRSC